MNNLVSFFNNEKNNVALALNEVNEKINQNKFELENINKKILEHSKNIDTTYEIFSPNAYDKDYNILEIEKLNETKRNVSANLEKQLKEKDVLLKRRSVVDYAFQDYILEKEKFDEELEEHDRMQQKKLVNMNENHTNEITQILEYQIRKDHHFISNEVERQLSVIESKLSLCNNFVDMDINRAKLEMLKIAEDISYFKKSLNSEMFHVKHFDDFSRLNLNSEIRSFINHYKKNINSHVDYKYIGRKIDDSSYHITNVIRIIKEAIDNAEHHGNGTSINVTVLVQDRYSGGAAENELDNSSNEKLKTEIDLELFNASKYCDSNSDYEYNDYNDNKEKHNLNQIVQENSHDHDDLKLDSDIQYNSNDDFKSGDDIQYNSNDDFKFGDDIQYNSNDDFKFGDKNQINDNDNSTLNVVDHFNEIEENPQQNNNNDMHQINFIITETTDQFDVTIKITDNGDGFHLFNDNLLIENEKYGIYLMKYRTQKLHGKLYIESSQGIGTTVSLIYQAG